MSKLRLALIAVAVMCVTTWASASTVLGAPVTAIGSNTIACPACYNSSTGKVTFYIPLGAANSGTFGVSNGGTVGTVADTGSGLSNSLTMYMKFSPVVLPANSATLTFKFTDLDLHGVNDPTGFFENVQFFSAGGTAISPLITNDPASGSAGVYLAYSVTGDANTQTIYFPDVTSILQNPFYVKLTFGSQYTTTGQNTPEDLIATLQTTQAPEPGSLWLLGAGLMGSIKLLRRRS